MSVSGTGKVLFTTAECLLQSSDFVRNAFVIPYKVEEGTQGVKCQETWICTVCDGVRGSLGQL